MHGLQNNGGQDSIREGACNNIVDSHGDIWYAVPCGEDHFPRIEQKMSARTTENALSSNGSIPEIRLSVDQHEIDYFWWFILLRWIAVGAATALTIIAVYGMNLLPPESGLPLIAVVTCLAALNAVYSLLYRKGRGTAAMTALQAYADLVLLTVLIHFSGGIENPLVLLMIFHVIIAGITLSRRQCFTVAGVATLLFAVLAWAEATGFVAHYTLRLVPHYEEAGHVAHAAHDPVYVASFTGLQGAILFLTALFVTALSERLRQKEHELGILARRALTQRQLLERSLETTGTALYVCDSDLHPILTNSRWDLWSEQIQSDEQLREGFFGEDSPCRLTLESGRIRVTEIGATPSTSLLAIESNATTFQTTTAPLLDRDEKITHIVQLVQDITDRKNAQAQLMRAGQLAAVGELAGQVAHEVNNPIAIINTKARLLVSDHREGMADRTAEELEKIIRLSDRVAGIAQGLLSFSRPSGAARGRINIESPIRRALAMVEQRADNAGIEISDEIPEQLSPVYANEQEIEQVFLNLFLNGIDAMPSGGRLTISASMHEDKPSEVQFVVSDTGTGMSAGVRARIFEPFFTTKPEGKGTGLGLSICHGLIQNNGGIIDVDSSVGGGTRVSIRLPALQP